MKFFLKKWHALNFRKKVISLFESYLSGRIFKVNTDKKLSDSGYLTCGVPQRSILGPLLFLIYVNDMHQDVKCDLLLYAVDICLTFQHEKVKETEDQLNLNFSSLCDWITRREYSRYFLDMRLSD